jgi:hypothetical protein
VNAKTKRQALRRLRGLAAGETVYVLCAKIDPDGSNQQEEDEPAVDARSFSWVRAIVTGLSEASSPEVDDVPGLVRDAFQVEFDDKSTTYYERRFLLTYEEAVALKLPKVPAP